MRILILLFLLLILPQVVLAEESLDAVIRNATEKNLSSHPTWHALLHYTENSIWPGVTSEADAELFFLAIDGKVNPQAELEASIRAFARVDLEGDDHPQCLFIARFRWLDSMLGLDSRVFKRAVCAQYEEWKNEIAPTRTALVFPSAFLRNPSSMFGHTLLRIDAEGQSEETSLLAYAANYAADTSSQDNDVLYALKGLFGGYPGFFTVLPYYKKVEEYNDLEKRDVWEYQLSLSEQETERIVEHLWELRRVYYDYFYFKENCSYHLLSLLEVAKPEFKLRNKFSFWATPVDTVRAVKEYPGTISRISFRPAAVTILEYNLNRLSAEERSFTTSLAKDSSDKLFELDAFESENKALILELAYDLVQFFYRENKMSLEHASSRSQKLLVARSAMKDAKAMREPQPPSIRPDQGHETSRVSVGIGARDSEGYYDISFRPAYHDLLDPSPGFSSGAQIQLFQTRLRHYKERSLRLEELLLADVFSLSPASLLFDNTAWRLQGAVSSRNVADGEDSLVGAFVGGRGKVYHLGDAKLFAMLEGRAEYSGHFQDTFVGGVGPHLGLRVEPTDRWTVLASGSAHRFFLGDRFSDAKLSLESQIMFFSQSGLRVKAQRVRDFDRYYSVAQLELVQYF